MSHPFRMRTTLLVSLVVVAVMSSGIVMAAHVNPTVVDTVSVGDSPRGVAVDPDNNRVYVSNQGEDTISVIDSTTNTVVDTISTDRPKEIVLNPDTDRLYVPNALARTVSIVDTTTNTVIKTLSLGFRPRGAAINPTIDRVYVTNAGSGTVSVIDTTTNTVVDTIVTGDVPPSVDVNEDTNRVYVTKPRSDEVAVIDGNTNTIATTISVGDEPRYVAVNQDTGQVYVANSASISVIDGASNTVTETLSVTSPSSVTVAPDTDRFYVTSRSENDVLVFNASTNTVVDTVSVGDGPRNGALNPVTDRVYIANIGGNSVSVIADSNTPPQISTDTTSITVAEGDTATNTGTVSDPDSDAVSLTASIGTVTSNGDGTWSWSFPTTDGPDQSQTVTITVTDENGATNHTTFDLTVTNVAPSVTIDLDETGIAGEPVTLNGSFTDPGDDTHTAHVDWGDGTSESVAVDQVDDALSTTHTYASGGRFTVELTVTDDDGASTTVTDTITVTHVVEMDLKPGNGDEPDPVNPRSKGVTPVVIKTTNTFDATTVNVSSLRFGSPDTVAAGDGSTPAHGGHLEDVDGDGDQDLVVHFRGDTGLEHGDDTAAVRGMTRDGVPLQGTDAIRTPGRGNGPP